MAKGRIKINSKGSFTKTEKFLKACSAREAFDSIDRYAQMGVDALRENTPVDSGLTADSWGYRIIRKERRNIQIEWYNTNFKDGYSIALLIQHGHGTRDGSYVKGRDFINPAIQPIFDKIAHEVWNEVMKS